MIKEIVAMIVKLSAAHLSHCIFMTVHRLHGAANFKKRIRDKRNPNVFS
jgi:hypothetical protein